MHYIITIGAMQMVHYILTIIIVIIIINYKYNGINSNSGRFLQIINVFFCE